jgi:hypothetical protein
VQQVIHSSHLIVLVFIKANCSKIRLKSELLKVLKHLRLDWNFIFSNYQTLGFVDRLVQIAVPWVLLYLVRGETFVRVGLHYFG